ncbi:hypothetical protein K523DRAFT_378108, partial [Schizophyllum commune Tattone D]
MLTVEPSLDDLLNTTSVITPFPKTRAIHLYHSVDHPTRRPLCPNVTRDTVRGRRHAYRKSIQSVTTRVTNLLLPTTTSTPSAARCPPTWPATTTPTEWPSLFPILTPRDGHCARQLRRFYDPQTAGGMRGDPRAVGAKIVSVHPASRFSESLRYLSIDLISATFRAPEPPEACAGPQE